jgi:hypothetical protein
MGSLCWIKVERSALRLMLQRPPTSQVRPQLPFPCFFSFLADTPPALTTSVRLFRAPSLHSSAAASPFLFCVPALFPLSCRVFLCFRLYSAPLPPLRYCLMPHVPLLPRGVMYLYSLVVSLSLCFLSTHVFLLVFVYCPGRPCVLLYLSPFCPGLSPRAAVKIHACSTGRAPVPRYLPCFLREPVAL